MIQHGRKDHKNRLLREGESQCKDGRYRYTYYANGKQKSLYSWKLEENDKLPYGKRDCVALRVQIEDLQRKQLLFGRYFESSYTVLDLVERYVGMKTGVRKSTRTGYKTVVIIPYDSYHESQITIPTIRGNRTSNTLFSSTCKVADAQ